VRARKVHGLAKETLADEAFVLRQLEELADDTRKDCRAVKETIEKCACLLWVEENMNTSGRGDPIRGDLCVATPDVKEMASLPRPKTQPEQYGALMTWLGIPLSVVAQDLVRPHWPGFTDKISELAATGQPLPPGIDPDKTYPLYKLTTRLRRGVQIDEL